MNIIAIRTIPIILLSFTCLYCVQSKSQNKSSVTTDVNPVGQTFTSSDGNFSINLPDKPSKAEPQANNSSKGQMSGYKYSWYTSDGIYNVSYLEFAYRIDDEKTSSQFLDNLSDKLVSKTNGRLQSLQALALISLKMHARGYNISGVFFGIYMLLLGCLIFKSGFLPRMLGVLMALGGLSYLTDSFAIFLLPALVARLPDIGMIGGLAELALSLWLTAVGVNVPKWEEKARARQFSEA